MSGYRCLNCETPHDSLDGAMECCACPHCAELQSKLDAVKGCDQHQFMNYEPDLSDRVFFEVKDVLAAIGEQEVEDGA